MIPALALVALVATSTLTREERLGRALVHAQQRADVCAVDLREARAELMARTPAALADEVPVVPASSPWPGWLASGALGVLIGASAILIVHR